MITNFNGMKNFEHSTKFQQLLELHDQDFVLETESKLHPQVCLLIPSFHFHTHFCERIEINAYGGEIFPAIEYDLSCIEEVDFNEDKEGLRFCKSCRAV